MLNLIFVLCMYAQTVFLTDFFRDYRHIWRHHLLDIFLFGLLSFAFCVSLTLSNVT